MARAGSRASATISCFADLDIDGFFVSGEGRYFATDNLKLSLKGGFNTFDFEDEFRRRYVHRRWRR